MATPFCIIPRQANEFKQAIIRGEIDINALRDMSSKDRREFFSKYFGESDAKRVNALYEQKLVLKNYERGMVNWAKKVTGLSVDKKRDLQNRIQNMIKRGELTADNKNQILSDLVEYRLGASVSETEAKKITELSNKAKELSNFTTDKDRIEYGKALIDLHQYTDEITKRRPKLGTTVVDLLNVPRSLMTSIDLSALMNQGYATIGSKEWRNSTKNVLKMFASEKAYNEVMADIITRENYDIAKRAGLRITKMSDKLSEREEGFMSNFAEIVPGVRGSGRAYSGFLNKLRMDTFDRMITQARLNGEDVRVGSENAQKIADVVNTFTGSGGSKKLDSAVPVLNSLFFSPRKIIATFNMFNPKIYLNSSPQVRKYAWTRLANMALVYGAIRGLSSLIGGEPEDDPRSVNFGKIKVGRRWIDASGSNGRFINLVASLITGEIKKSDTDIIKKLNDGSYKGDDRYQALSRWVRNKLSPWADFVVNALKGEDFLGEKFSLTKELTEMFIPMSMNDLFDAASGKETWDEALLGTTLNVLGINSYIDTGEDDWSRNETKEILQFRASVSEDNFNEANKVYNTLYREKFEKLINSDEYKRKSDTDKQNDITALKKEVKESVFKRFDFKYNKNKKVEDFDSKSQETKSGSYIKSTDAPQGFFETSDLYIKSIWNDPIQTVKAFVAGNPIRKVENGIVVLERKNGIGADGNPDTELDHIIDLRFGGTNEDSNLMYLTKADHAVKTKVGNYLQKELEAGNINKKEARERILNWRNEIDNLKKKDAGDLVDQIMKSD